ncbi:hypothetical protein LIA77_02114 [Sarocladium implicatum]|nr:hypothetical protein LIA77_02114 [Sarocladium implicatum]
MIDLGSASRYPVEFMRVRWSNSLNMTPSSWHLGCWRQRLVWQTSLGGCSSLIDSSNLHLSKCQKRWEDARFELADTGRGGGICGPDRHAEHPICAGL